MADSEGSNSSSEMSEDFQERLSELKAKWKAALKRNKKLLLKCPNYTRCQFKCGSVGGMHYHFVRCAGNAPQFKCHQCSRQYESRTGLNYHMASSHGNEPVDDLKSDSPSSRPQRSAAITTLSAIHISNNPPPLKQHLPSHKPSPTATKPPPTSNKTPPTTITQQLEEQKPVQATNSVAVTPPPPSLLAEEQPIKKALTPPTSKHAGTKRVKGEGSSRQKKNKYVTIPSIEYPDEYKSFLPLWRQEMKDNKIIKCPNFEECEFKCTTVNGMKYHYVRCMKSNPPEFNCELCDKKFQCRTGLVWHLKKTHKLIDIQPSKTGGFKGTIPTDAMKMSEVNEILGLASSTAAVFAASSPSLGRPGRKKIKLEQKGSMLLGKTRMLLSNNGRKCDGSRYRARKRLRKSTSPRRTAYNILQNVLLKHSSKPKLGPQTKKLHLPMMEFIIANDIPTDVDPQPSAIIQLGEEALQWQRMYSDSEGESDYNPDGEDISRQFEFQSNSSASDSDEDYTCSFSTGKKKRGPKPGVKYGEKMTSGRGMSRKGRGGKTMESKEVPMLVRPPEDARSYMIQPPPLLVKRDKQEDLIQPRAARVPPALIKTSKINNQSNHDVNEEFDRLTNLGMVTSQLNNSSETAHHITTPTHVQPPPSLVMPTPQLREPPPLVKKEEGTSPSTAFYPHIMLPSTTDQPASFGSKRIAHPLEGVGMVQSSTTTPPPAPAPVPRRPGRPRKDQSNTSQSGLKTSSKTVRLGSTKAHYKPLKGAKSQTSSYSVKGMKMTQYEFQSVSMAQHLTKPTLSTTSHQHTPQQHQHMVLAPGNTAVQVPNVQNVVTPLQIIPAASLQYPNIGSVPGGSVLYVQGAPQGVAIAAPQGNEMSSTYITQDGNAYQLVQATPAQVGDDNAQKVSVIMHPGTAGGAGGVQYITQLDGPPPKVSKTTCSLSSKDLRKRFEEARRTERVKLEGTLQQQIGVEKMVTESSGTGMHSSSSKVAVSVSDSLSDLSIGIESSPQTCSSSSGGMGTRHGYTEVKRNTSPEELMSVQLKSYFKMEQARKAKCLSPPSSGMSRDAITFNVATSTTAPSTDPSCQSERKKNRQSSMSVSHGESTSPTRGVKSPKSPRLVISPTLFSPTSSSTKSERNGQSMAVSVESVTNIKTTSTTTTTAKKKRQQLKSVKPDLQNLFFPDNISTTILSPQKTTSCKKLPEPSNKPVEFSTTLHDSTSSLKRPTPIHHKGHNTQHILQHNSNHSNSNETTSSATATVSSSDSENSSNKEDTESSSSSSTTPNHSTASSLKTTPTKQPLTLEVQPSCLRLGKHAHSESNDVVSEAIAQLGESSGTSQPADIMVPSTPPAKMRQTRKSTQRSEYGSTSSKTKHSPETPVSTKRRGRGKSRMAKQSPSQQTPPQRTKSETPTAVGGVEPMDTSEPADSTPAKGSVQKTPVSRGRPRKKPVTSGKRVYNCPKCDKQYTTQPGLKSHLRTVHADTGLTAESPISECLKVWKQLFKQQKSVLCMKCGTHKANSVSAMRYHWQKCGKSKDEVSVSCPHCSRTYQSKAGLTYHINVQHTVKPEPEVPSPLQQQSPLPSPSPRDIFAPLPARRAARQAVEKLTEFISKEPTATEDADSAAIQMDASNVLLEKEGALVGSLSESQLAQLKAELAREGMMKCPYESCTKTFKTLGGIKYHIRNHEDKKQLQCPLCKKLMQSRKRMENHLRSKHPAYQLENLDDLEYTPPVAAAEEESEGSDSELHEDLIHDGEDEVGDEREQKKHSKLKSSSTISSYTIPRTFKEYQSFITKVLKRLYSHEGEWELQDKEWQAQVADWTKVSGSELSACLPKATTSVKFIFSSSSVGNGAEFYLPLFGSTGTDFPVTTFFAGGPVWAMDWLPVKDVTDEQFVALSAYAELDERHPTEGQFSHQGLIQLWSMGLLENNKDCSDTCVPKLSLGIAHNFGCVRAMKWYPNSISSLEDGDNPARLGVLAVSCSDGYVRILSIPELKTLAAALSTKKKKSSSLKHLPTLSEERHFVKPKREAALLVPNGMGTLDNSAFGQCLCLDWLPGNKYTRIAAGFSNGSVCVWDFTSTFLRFSDSKSGTLTIHPLTQLAAHSAPCRCVAWCPHNYNYLFTGGHDKMVALWDLRQPFSPIEKQERGGNVVYEAIWPLLWCSIIGVLDTSLGLQPNNSLFYMSYLHSQPGFRNRKAITSSSAPLCTESYSIWTDSVVAGSYGGELSLVTFPSSFHVISSPKNIMHTHKMIYSCRMEPLGPAAAAATGDEPSLEDESQETSNNDISKVLKQRKKTRTKVKSEDSRQVSGQSSTDVDEAAAATSTSIGCGGEALTMEELAKSHRLVFKDYHSNEASGLSFETDVLPLQAVTKVSWNPNQGSCNWLLLGTNSGLVQLLHVAPPSKKPLSSCR